MGSNLLPSLEGTNEDTNFLYRSIGENPNFDMGRTHDYKLAIHVGVVGVNAVHTQRGKAHAH